MSMMKKGMYSKNTTIKKQQVLAVKEKKSTRLHTMIADC